MGHFEWGGKKFMLKKFMCFFCPLVSNAALGNAALVLSSEIWKEYSRWVASSKNKSKKPWVFCRGAGIDAALVRVQFVLRGCTHR